MQPYNQEELVTQHVLEIHETRAEIRRGKLFKQTFKMRLATGRLLIATGERLVGVAMEPAPSVQCSHPRMLSH